MVASEIRKIIIQSGIAGRNLQIKTRKPFVVLMRSLNLFHLLLQKHGSRRDSVFTRYLLRGASEFGRHIKNNTKHEQLVGTISWKSWIHEVQLELWKLVLLVTITQTGNKNETSFGKRNSINCFLKCLYRSGLWIFKMGKLCNWKKLNRYHFTCPQPLCIGS